MRLAPFIATYTGGRAYPLGLDLDQIKIEDIAHSLSQQCRYAGHVSEFWSVAAHSLEVSHRVVERALFEGAYSRQEAGLLGLAGLLHDASEAYLMDIVKPLKPLLQGYGEWEANVEMAIAQKFGLPFPHPEIVKTIDQEMVRHEVFNFFPRGSAAWERYGITEKDNYPRLMPLEPKIAEQRFLRRFDELTEKL